ncbi:envelope glycoprotein O [Cercopithecine betaherpesvirus 5]|uniref:Envelope glycoprotein O n=1 Tax=Simian cytomegalovirus (strain Colburn) TaxID=50292 RepID=G8XTD5_SCMVC|nr:envelope glycoprotein O [Cercopithecine betaherpesvirus 5]AEV80427.1 envelope glycoprotein O [Cercopithecine betaherpesvirus 5]
MGSETHKWYILLLIIGLSYSAQTRKTTKSSTGTQVAVALTGPQRLSFRNYPITIPLSRLPDKHLLLAGPVRNESVTYFWYDFYSPILRQPNKYVMCKYNRTNSTMTLVPPPCGSIPSMNCLSEMINMSLHNDTGEESCTLNTTFNPMLYNIPRWTTILYLDAKNIFLDSQTIYFLGLSEAIFRNLRRHNCTKSFYLINAMSRNLFRNSRVSLWKLKQTMRRLKRRQKPIDKTKSKKSKRSINNTTTAPNATVLPTIFTSTTYKLENMTNSLNTSETFKPPIFISQLKDMVTWFYTTIRYTQKAFCKESRDRKRQSAWANHTRQILYNNTVWSIHGTMNLTDLYQVTPPYINATTINDSLFIDPLWDHINSLAFIEEIRLNKTIDTYTRPTNVSLSILPP